MDAVFKINGVDHSVPDPDGLTMGTGIRARGADPVYGTRSAATDASATMGAGG